MIAAPRWLRLASALLLAAAVILLSVLPGVTVEGDSRFQWHVEAVPSALQNSMHLVLYGMLFCTSAWALGGRGRRGVTLTVAVAALTLGIVLELVQLQVPGRFASVLDATLNTVGVACGYLAWRACQRKRGPDIPGG